MEFTLTFLKVFVAAIFLTYPLLLFLSFIVAILGQLVGHFEKWNKFDAFYWSFITATTVGYGDIRPLKKISKLIAILIAFIGLMFTGIVVAITVESASVAFDQHVDPIEIEAIAEQIR